MDRTQPSWVRPTRPYGCHCPSIQSLAGHRVEREGEEEGLMELVWKLGITLLY
jgi:hypothetical protein